MEVKGDLEQEISKRHVPLECYTKNVDCAPKFSNAPRWKIIWYQKKSNKIFQYIFNICLSANLLSNIRMLIYPDLYVKTTYLNFSQRLLMFINVYQRLGWSLAAKLCNYLNKPPWLCV